MNDGRILVTGGAGFIGANFVLYWLESNMGSVVNLDALTYAGNLQSLASLQNNPRHTFVHGNIGDQELVARVLAEHKPQAIINFAAETHVDRSISGPEAFLNTNVLGTCRLLQAALAYFETLSMEERSKFRFLHVSTDEVYGTLGPDDPAFSEQTRFSPNSPYAASKAGSDLLVRAWTHTYGLPTLITNCSNNYGPLQFPEKLIPLVIHRALAGQTLPVYGDGQQVRDWLYVTDHCRAIEAVLANGAVGETYNVGGNNQVTNLEVVHRICDILDELMPESAHVPHRTLVRFVDDRPGHDRRYAVDATKIRTDLGWLPQESFETGLRRTVEWYLEHREWVRYVTSGDYQHWISSNYSRRTEAGAVVRS